MTREEILETDENCKTEKGWLKEIAYQLACLTESETSSGTAIIGEDFIKKVSAARDEANSLTPPKRGPGRPPKTQ